MYMFCDLDPPGSSLDYISWLLDACSGQCSIMGGVFLTGKVNVGEVSVFLCKSATS